MDSLIGQYSNTRTMGIKTDIVLLVVIAIIIGWAMYTIFTNNDTYANTSKNIHVALYYATWCGWSKKFLPVWKELKEGPLSSQVDFVEFECSEERKECAGVPGFPTIALSVGGKRVDYEGERTAKALTEFIKSYM